MTRSSSYYPSPPASTLAVVSLVSGIVGWVAIPLLGALVAVITGHLAKREIRASGGDLGGDGLATAGLVIGYIQLISGAVCLCSLLVMILTGAAIPFLDQLYY